MEKKTMLELLSMMEEEMQPFGNSYNYVIQTLVNDYLSKSDGIERIKFYLSQWESGPAKRIATQVVDEIQKSGMRDFNPDEIMDLV